MSRSNFQPFARSRDAFTDAANAGVAALFRREPTPRERAHNRARFAQIVADLATAYRPPPSHHTPEGSTPCRAG